MAAGALDLIEETSAAPALLACAGKTLPDGLPIDCCHTCARRWGSVVVLAGVMEPAAQFVEAGDRVGWRCVNYRSTAV